MLRLSSPSSSHFGRWPLVVLLLAALLSSQRLAAQTAPALGASPADAGAVLVFNNWYLPRYEASPGGAADTTGALLALFRKRRYAGYLYTIPFIVGMSLALPIASTNSRGQRQVASEAISPPLGSAILAAGLVGFIVHANKFNKSHLVAVDRAYVAGTPIPARYRHLLTERHFAEAALLRTAIAQQKARE